SMAILNRCDFQWLSPEIVEQIGFDINALTVQDAPEVVPRGLVVGGSRLILVDASGHDDVEVLLACDPQLPEELLVLRLEGLTKFVEQAVDGGFAAGQMIGARGVAAR